MKTEILKIDRENINNDYIKKAANLIKTKRQSSYFTYFRYNYVR